MDAAGLSAGLMYGGGGASGGGAGSTTGAPMGATGAAGAGSAADPNAQLQALMSLRQVRMSERKNEAEINLLNTQADALKAEAGKNKEETQSIIEKRLWQVKQEMFEGWKGFIDTANQLWDQMVKWQPTKKTTIDGKEIIEESRCISIGRGINPDVQSGQDPPLRNEVIDFVGERRTDMGQYAHTGLFGNATKVTVKTERSHNDPPNRLVERLA